ncbi:MAG: hypothetical protein INR71_13450 [Terriglobus roseus]|nr:hypothetical protein [Terriglobus roseus]
MSATPSSSVSAAAQAPVPPKAGTSTEAVASTAASTSAGPNSGPKPPATESSQPQPQPATAPPQPQRGSELLTRDGFYSSVGKLPTYHRGAGSDFHCLLCVKPKERERVFNKTGVKEHTKAK